MAAACLVVMATLAVVLPAAAQVELYAQGEPYQNGSMTMNVVATGQVGSPVILAYGLSPLPLLQPVVTGKGPFFIGSLLNALAIGVIGSSGRLDLPFAMPHYIAPGIPVVVQAFVSGSLSNPATIALDAPYFVTANATVIPSPNPTPGANFGDRVAAGDLNGDGFEDLAVGAWFEDYLGIDRAGRVYVLWGPQWNTYTALGSPNPGNVAGFGGSVLIADLDKDGLNDLIVGELVSDPPTPPDTATLYVYFGNGTLNAPSFALQSPNAGLEAAAFGRHAVIGDFNGDSWPDIADSMGSATVAGQSSAGEVAVFWGPSFAVQTVIANPTPAAGDFFGSRLVAADVDGDGIDDLVEGSGRAGLPGATQAGKVHVFVGPSLALVATIPNPLGALKNARFAEGLHAADLNGDGLAEIVAADVKNRLFILWGPTWSSYTLRKRPPSAFVNPFGETVFGEYLASTDVNLDGVPDLVIADYFSGALTGCSPGAEGTIYVSLGPYYSTYRTIFEPQPAWGDGFSWGSITFDLDGDGRDEILSGSPTAEVGTVFNGGRLNVLRP